MTRLCCALGWCAVLLVACGGRSVGVTPDAGPGTDARPGFDAGPGPDGSTAACRVPDDPVVIHNEVEPGFVMSLSRMGDHGYVLGGATGWSDLRAGLWILDGDSLEPQGVTWLDGVMVWARYDRDNDDIVAVLDLGNRLELRRYERGPDADLQVLEIQSLCDSCTPAWSSPLVDSDRVAVAVRDLGQNTVRVLIYVTGTGLVVETVPVVGSTPHLVGRDNGPFLLYEADGALWGQPYDWDGQPLANAISLLSSPVIGVITAEGSASETSWGAILEGDPDAPVFWLLQQGSGATAQALFQIPEMLPYVMEGHLSDNGRTVAFAWGETFGEGRVGPHAVVADRQTGQIQYGPALVDAPAAGSASYSVWAAVAPHPDGHAIVWGGWREQGNYGIYGKVLSCR